MSVPTTFFVIFDSLTEDYLTDYTNPKVTLWGDITEITDNATWDDFHVAKLVCSHINDYYSRQNDEPTFEVHVMAVTFTDQGKYG